MRRWWLSKSAPTSIAMSIRRGLNLPFPRQLSLGKPCVFNDNLDYAPAKESSQCLVKNSIVGKRALSRLYIGYGIEAVGFLPVSFVMTHPTNMPRRVIRLPPQGAVCRVLLQDPRYSTNSMALFSHNPLNLAIALFILVLSRF